MNTEKLNPYDILLYKGTGFTSWLVEVGTGSQYSHVAAVVDPIMHLGIESNTGHKAGVRTFNLRKLHSREVDVFRVKPEFHFDGAKVVSFLEDHLGAKYDWTGVISLAGLKVLSFLTLGFVKLHNDFQIKKDYFCSELVWDAFNYAGLDIVPQIGDAEITSPGDIAASQLLQKITG